MFRHFIAKVGGLRLRLTNPPYVLTKNGRSLVTVIDREGLEEIAADFYGVPESELRRLMA